MSFWFICPGCIFKSQTSSALITQGNVQGDHLFIHNTYAGVFAALRPRCGFCAEPTRPDTAGTVFLYPKDQHSNISLSMHYHSHLHDADCDCSGCILQATNKQQEEEEWDTFEDDPGAYFSDEEM